MVEHRRTYRISAVLALGWMALVMLGACATSNPALDEARLHVSLPGLPDDGPAWSRRVSDVATLDGISTYMDCGAPGAVPHSTMVEWLTLDGSAAGDFAWAIWRVPLTVEIEIQQFRLNLQQSGFNKYWLGYADYTEGTWVFGDETQGSATLVPPAEEALHSPGQYAYLAAVVLPGETINVTSLELTFEGGGPGPEDPIFDQFEDNDSLEDCHLLAPGEYRASIHETLNLEMSDPNEYLDKFDFYCVNVPEGSHLTATIRFEVFDHFGEPNYNDLDLLFYLPGSTLIYDEFIESASGITIYYYPFEQAYWESTATADYIVGVIGDVDLIQHIPSNAEYDINLFVSAEAYTVSGLLTQEGAEPDHSFLVFLEPGNFNCVTTFDTVPHGKIEIRGVPDGSYTMKVHSSAGFSAMPFVWPETLPVIVSGADVTGASIDIGPDPA